MGLQTNWPYEHTHRTELVCRYWIYCILFQYEKKKNYSAVTLLQCGKKITFKGISQFKKMGVSNEGKNGGLETEEANVM